MLQNCCYFLSCLSMDNKIVDYAFTTLKVSQQPKVHHLVEKVKGPVVVVDQKSTKGGSNNLQYFMKEWSEMNNCHRAQPLATAGIQLYRLALPPPEPPVL